MTTYLAERIQADVIVEQKLSSLLDDLRLSQSHPDRNAPLGLLQGTVQKQYALIKASRSRMHPSVMTYEKFDKAIKRTGAVSFVDGGIPQVKA